MSGNNNNKFGDRFWNAKKLIKFSGNLGAGYNLGTDSAKSDRKTNFWTTDKFIAMSKNLSSAYGVDFQD